MPKVTIWIRDADFKQWKAIKNKPEWLHEHLSMPKFTKVQLSEEPVPKPDSSAPYLFATTTKSAGVLTEDYLKDITEAIWPKPPKCNICGNYHFGGDLQAIEQWHEPTSEPMEEAA